jgi:hypothetical protein
MDFVAQRVLHALFLLSRDNLPISAVSLAAKAGVTPTRAATALCGLDQAGLADASRARLTMRGLVVALANGGALGGTGPQAANSAPPLPGVRKLGLRYPWAARAAGSQGACA